MHIKEVRTNRFIGLTGGIASGKSSVTKILKDKGYATICADELSRQLTVPNSLTWREIILRFGEKLLNKDQTINRKLLAQVVFSDLLALADLELILHPKIQQTAEEEKLQFYQQGHTIVFYDLPLLFEKNLMHMFNDVILVCCTAEQQIERLLNNRNMTNQEIDQRLKMQIPLNNKCSLTQWIINNTKDFTHLTHEVDKILFEMQL